MSKWVGWLEKDLVLYSNSNAKKQPLCSLNGVSLKETIALFITSSEKFQILQQPISEVYLLDSISTQVYTIIKYCHSFFGYYKRSTRTFKPNPTGMLFSFLNKRNPLLIWIEVCFTRQHYFQNQKENEAAINYWKHNTSIASRQIEI